MEEKQGGNPTPDFTKGDDEFGSAENFFDALEAEVNSAITESEKTDNPVTPQETQGPVKATPEKSEEGTKDEVDWEKRYKDSSREAQNLNSKLKDMEQYVPILDAMKKDRGLVDHVRDYVQDGGKSQSIQEKLKLDEDFVFDPQEAMTDPSSDSARLFNAHVEKTVGTRVAKAQDVERRRNANKERKSVMDVEAKAFREKHKMNEDDFNKMMSKAKSHKMSLDDIHYLLNRDQTNANIANNTKKEMLDQMKNVRDIPASSAGVNSAKVEQKYEDEVFDALKGSDGDLESLFGE